MNILLSLFHWILAAGFRASLLSIAVLLFQAALRPIISARARYLLWLPVLIVLMTPILPRSRWSVENLFASHTRAPAPVLEPATAPEVEVTPAGSEAPSVSSLDWKETGAAIVWAAGAVLSLGSGLLLYHLALRRFLQMAEQPDVSLTSMIASLSAELRLRRPPRIILSPAVESPAVTGLLRPLLLLPAGFESAFTGKEARLVLKHELMHLKRVDLQVNALLFLLNTLHWFNPLLWLAAWRTCQDREAACDAQVLASETTDCRSDYGNVLLKAESARCVPWLSIGFVGIFEPGRGLRSRITAIAHYRRPGPLSAIVAAFAIVLLGVLGATHAQDAASGSPPLATSTGPAQTAGPNELITKEYRMLSSFRAAIGKRGPLDYLSAQGVPFPPGANVMYWSKSNRLIVHNTKPNIDVLDVILDAYLAPTSASGLAAEVGPRDDHPAATFSGIPDRASAAWGTPQYIEYKLEHIIIGKLDFDGGHLNQLVDAINKGGVQYDNIEKDPSRRGVKITLASEDVNNNYYEPFNSSFNNRPLITFLDRLRVHYAITPYGVSIDPSAMDTKEYNLPASALGTKTVEQFLAGNGVQISSESSMDYTPQTGRLVVRETPGNQELIDAVVRGVNGEQTISDVPAPEDANAVATDDTRQKLNNLIIPKFEFSNATMQDIVTYLNQESIRLDAGESIPSRRGVHFVLAAAPSGAGKISLSLDQMPMWEVVKYVAELSGLKVRVDPGSVTFLSPSGSSD